MAPFSHKYICGALNVHICHRNQNSDLEFANEALIAFANVIASYNI